MCDRSLQRANVVYRWVLSGWEIRANVWGEATEKANHPFHLVCMPVYGKMFLRFYPVQRIKRRKIARICALFKAYTGERAWKAIGDKTTKPMLSEQGRS
jgi:hypothetical protein